MKTETSRTNTIAALTLLTGLLALGTTLLALRHLSRARLVIADAHFTVLAGLSLIYLSMLLKRAKHNAWLIAVPVNLFLIIRNIQHFLFEPRTNELILSSALNLMVPTVTLVLLLIYRQPFRVRSEPQSFQIAVKRSIVILLIAFLYGCLGFNMFDERDFHAEISLPQSMHYTVDQIGLTTSDQPVAYTKRAIFFVDSLAAVSVASVFYAAVSFFSPIKFRLRHNEEDYENMKHLIKQHSTTSEDFFKLWPRDKSYFLNQAHSAGLAYRVTAGVALVVADPVGPASQLKALLESFQQYCWLNDWSIAFVHTEAKNLRLYSSLGFDSQKLGEEALISTEYFVTKLMPTKYFRHIQNKFSKLGYSFEALDPPHSPEVLSALKKISDDWLRAPGRAERSFMQGYYSDAYMQLCQIAVAKDAHGSIAAFINRLPGFNNKEANYDFLRAGRGCPGNINDYLMSSFIKYLNETGVSWLNMGLSPLAGLGSDRLPERRAMDSFLNFIYTKAGRFYSFTGLTRFKAKYEPHWQDRYIVYANGTRGLTMALGALVKAMQR